MEEDRESWDEDGTLLRVCVGKKATSSCFPYDNIFFFFFFASPNSLRIGWRINSTGYNTSRAGGE